MPRYQTPTRGSLSSGGVKLYMGGLYCETRLDSSGASDPLTEPRRFPLLLLQEAFDQEDVDAGPFYPDQAGRGGQRKQFGVFV